MTRGFYHSQLKIYEMPRYCSIVVEMLAKIDTTRFYIAKEILKNRDGTHILNYYPGDLDIKEIAQIHDEELSEYFPNYVTYTTDSYVSVTAPDIQRSRRL